METTAGLFGALEVAQRQYDLGCEVKEYLEDHRKLLLLISAVGWMILSGNVTTADALAITLTCRM